MHTQLAAYCLGSISAAPSGSQWLTAAVCAIGLELNSVSRLHSEDQRCAGLVQTKTST